MSKSTIIAITLAVVVVAGGGLAYFMYSQTSKNTYPAPQTGGSAQQTNTPAATYNPATGSTQPAQTTYMVNIKNFGFEPANATVKKGTLVIWDNFDNVTHTVVGDKGGPSSSRLNPGNSYGYTFNTVGSFPYHCSIHPNMKGTVTVVE